MKNLLMITGLGSAQDLARGRRGAFYNTLEELHNYFDRIDIIAPRISRTEATELFGNVFLHVSPWPLLFHPGFFLQKATSLHRKHHFIAMTVQDFPPFYNGIGAFLLWCRIRVPYMLEFHHIPGYPRAANIKESLYRLFAKAFVALDALPAAAVRVVNKHQTRKFLTSAGINDSKIHYIPSLYIDHDVFKRVTAPKEYDIIFIGRLAENKGIDLFLKAAKKLNLKTLIVGDGPEKSRVANVIKKYPNITLHGWAKDSAEIASLLNRSKLFVLTSYNEGGPRVVAEAMACGVPVLATPVGIVPDFSEACTTIHWEADDIIEKAQQLLNNPELYNSKVAAGLELIKKFEKKSAIKQYADEIMRLAVK